MTTESKNPHYPPERIAALQDAGKDTKFGGENANPPRQAVPDALIPWATRNATRKLLSQTTDINDPNALTKLLTDNGTRDPTIAEQLAMSQIRQGLKGNTKAYVAICDATEGKLALPIRNEGDTGYKPPPIINFITHGGDFAQKQGE